MRYLIKNDPGVEEAGGVHLLSLPSMQEKVQHHHHHDHDDKKYDSDHDLSHPHHHDHHAGLNNPHIPTHTSEHCIITTMMMMMMIRIMVTTLALVITIIAMIMVIMFIIMIRIMATTLALGTISWAVVPPLFLSLEGHNLCSSSPSSSSSSP